MPIHMTVTSIWFLLLLLFGIVVYYVMPKKFQWTVLLLMSIVYYFFAANIVSIIYPIFSALIAYTATVMFERKYVKDNESVKRTILLISVVLIVIPWLFTNASGLVESLSYRFSQLIPLIPVYRGISIPVAIGTAYYTSQLISYVVDCYWQNVEGMSNPIKVITYTIFFPQLTTGPISRFDKLKTLFDGHGFKYKNLCFGAQRILWGFLKKLVLADRIGIIVNAIWDNLDLYTGLWRIVALLLYPIQLYADFSGCMDIVLGAAELFDIHLEENFKSPFFSKSIREFWSRWHITLGKWAKDYVMYPILKSKKMVLLTKKCKKRFGKHLGKLLSAAFASGMVWFVMGIWHGGVRHIVGVSLYYWILIELGELFDPVWDKFFTKVNFNSRTFSWRLFQSVRTYVIYSVGAVFFQAPTVNEAFRFIVSCLGVFKKENINPWMLFNGSILDTGITYEGINLIIIGLVMLLIVGYLGEKQEYARIWIAKQGLLFRWIIWIVLFFIVLIYGAYGPGYDSAAFIYQGF